MAETTSTSYRRLHRIKERDGTHEASFLEEVRKKADG
jgi:hypothetical protein